MAYNPYNAVSMIHKFKSDWTDADSKGDNVKKFDAETNAQKYYNELKKNGYSALADELSKSNVEQAARRKNFYAQTGRTPTRDYLYSLGQKYDMSKNDVDKLISYNDITGEISFGGKNIGKPDVEADGVSYWNDTAKLDNAFKDYIDRSGTSRQAATAINQENENLFDKYNKEYDDLKKTNPFTTDEAKAILAKYDLAGLTARDNTAASGAGSNGGNIDSYSAANALRQQAALINQGQQAVINSYNSKLEHARNLLSDMGVNIERVFNENETAKNNDVSRKATIADVRGYTPSEWTVQSDPVLKNFVDENGKIKKEYENVDFQQLINQAKESGDNDLANKYAILRGIKIWGNYANYGKYAGEGDIAYPEQQKTENARQFDKQIASAEKIASGNNATKLTLADKSAQSALDQITTSAKYSSNNNGTVTKDDTATYQNGVKVGDKNGKPILTKDQAVKMRDSGNTSDQVTYALNYYGESVTPNGGTGLLGDVGDSNGASDDGWNAFMSYFPTKSNDKDRTKFREFLTEKLKPYYDSGREINETVLENLVVGTDVKNSNSTKYDIDVDEAKALCNALGLNTAWLDKYKNRWGFNSDKGMKLAN